MKGYNIAIFTCLIALGASFGYIHIDKRINSLKEENEKIKSLILKERLDKHLKTIKKEVKEVIKEEIKKKEAVEEKEPVEELDEYERKYRNTYEAMSINHDPCSSEDTRHPYCDDYEGEE